MRVWVELPSGWGPGRVIMTAWLDAGYQVEEHRSIGTGTRYMTVRGRPEPNPSAEPVSPYAHVPRVCPFGHELRPGHVLVGWAPCTCPPAWALHGGHRTYACEDCRTEYATTMICYMPEHAAGGDGLRRPQRF